MLPALVSNVVTNVQAWHKPAAARGRCNSAGAADAHGSDDSGASKGAAARKGRARCNSVSVAKSSGAYGDGSALLELKQRVIGASVQRTRTASSQMDLEDSENQLSDELMETESAVSASSPAHGRQARAGPAAGFDPYELGDKQPLRAAVFSFARAGLSGSKALLGKLPARKPHARSESELSESDFAPPPAGALVSTRFGLGTVERVRERDGVAVVALQGRARATLFAQSGDDEFFAVPALVGDWVVTPAGEGCVLAYDPRDQMYAVRVGGDAEFECRVRQSDVTRYVRPRRGSVSSGSTGTNALQKGLSTALKTLVSTSSGLSASTYQFVSNRYYQGQFVVTPFGSGAILALDAAQKSVTVQLAWGATAYLRAEAIQYYPKALEGMDVSTKFGAGRVEALRPADAIYTVRLFDAKDGESDVVYVHESDLARLRRLPSAVESVRGRWLAFANKRFARAERMSASRPEEEIHTAGI